jgi:hypothetical protein
MAERLVAVTATADEINTMGLDKVRLAVEHAAIVASASGATLIAAGEVGYRHVVLAYNFTSAGVVNAKWQSDSDDVTGLTYMDAAGKGKVCPYNPKGWFKTAEGEDLNINLSASVAIGGEVVYVMEPV